MGEPARGLATWEDLLNTPEDGSVTYEILDGNLEALPHPLPQHGWTQGMLFSDLSAPFGRGRGGPGGWWLILETDVRVTSHNIVAPDIAGWLRERMPAFPRPRPPPARAGAGGGRGVGGGWSSLRKTGVRPPPTKAGARAMRPGPRESRHS